MAWELHSYIVDPGDGVTIKVEHIFYGLTQAECRTYRDEHLGSCSYFRAAEDEGRTDEKFVEIEEADLPTIDDDDEEDG